MQRGERRYVDLTNTNMIASLCGNWYRIYSMNRPAASPISRAGLVFGVIVPLLAAAYLIYVGFSAHQIIQALQVKTGTESTWNAGLVAVACGSAVVIYCLTRFASLYAKRCGT